MKYLKKNPEVLMNIIPDSLNTLDIKNEIEIDESRVNKHYNRENKERRLNSIDRTSYPLQNKFNINNRNIGLNSDISGLTDNRKLNLSSIKNEVLPTTDTLNRSNIEASKTEYRSSSIPHVTNRDGLNSQQFSKPFIQLNKLVESNSKQISNDNEGYYNKTENANKSYASENFKELTEEVPSYTESISSKVNSKQQISRSSIIDKHTIIFEDRQSSNLSKINAINPNLQTNISIIKENSYINTSNQTMNLNRSQEIRKSVTVEKNTQTGLNEGGEYDTDENKNEEIYLNTNSVEQNPELADEIVKDSNSISKYTLNMDTSNEGESVLSEKESIKPPEKIDRSIQIKPDKETKNKRIQFSSPKDENIQVTSPKNKGIQFVSPENKYIQVNSPKNKNIQVATSIPIRLMNQSIQMTPTKQLEKTNDKSVQMTTLKDSLGKLKNSSPVHIPQSKTMIRYAKPKPFEYNGNNKNSIREKPPMINKESENEYKDFSIPLKVMEERSQYEFDPNILYKSDGSIFSKAHSGQSIGVQAQSFNLSASIQADGTEIDEEAQRQSYESSIKQNQEMNKSIQAEEPWKNEDIQ